MTVNTKKEAWDKADEIFPTDYIKDELASANAGYDVYRSTVADRYYCYICDLGSSLEINLDNGETIRINIKAETEKTKTYLVIAKRWSSEKKAQIEYVAGKFDEFANANIFKTAYNEHYSANAYIVEYSE